MELGGRYAEFYKLADEALAKGYGYRYITHPPHRTQESLTLPENCAKSVTDMPRGTLRDKLKISLHRSIGKSS
jgi:hypothetical protein